MYFFRMVRPAELHSKTQQKKSYFLLLWFSKPIIFHESKNNDTKLQFWTNIVFTENYPKSSYIWQRSVSKIGCGMCSLVLSLLGFLSVNTVEHNRIESWYFYIQLHRSLSMSWQLTLMSVRWNFPLQLSCEVLAQVFLAIIIRKVSYKQNSIRRFLPNDKDKGPIYVNNPWARYPIRRNSRNRRSLCSFLIHFDEGRQLHLA